MSETNESQSLNQVCHKNVEFDRLISTIEQRKILRAAILINVVPSDANPRASIKRQIDACRKFIDQNGWTISDMYVARENNCIDRLANARAKLGDYFDVIVATASLSCESPRSHRRTLSVLGVCNAKLFAIKGSQTA